MQHYLKKGYKIVDFITQSESNYYKLISPQSKERRKRSIKKAQRQTAFLLISLFVIS